MNLSDYEPIRRPRMTRKVMRGFSAEAFSEARRNKNISVADLARMADVSQATIFNWERGSGTPQVDLLARVMKYLKTPIDHVVLVPLNERFPGDWRVVRGMTQPELAAAAGIATSTLKGIERAEATLTDTNAAILAALLDISTDDYREAWDRCRHRPPGTTA